MRPPKSRESRKQKRLSEVQEIELLESWIQNGRPESGSNPLSLPPPPKDAPVGRIDDGTFSAYAGSQRFDQLPLSQKTRDGLKDAKFTKMTEIQRASLPHSLCGRDILGAAKTGERERVRAKHLKHNCELTDEKDLWLVLEKLYKARWGPEDGVGSIIISPTRELAAQLFDVLKSVGKHHNFSAGLLIGGRKDIDTEKEHVNDLNILVCTPGRLLQHMDETPNFDCSQLQVKITLEQVLVLDEADRILDVGFKKALNAIVSQLPKHRQTFLFSATQTKSVQDLARLSLKDPEYLSVHEESVTATPNRLHQTAMIVPLDQKLDMLWSFIKSHLNSKILVFLSSCKQVRFVFEAFKKLHPGIPLKCLHGRMKQERRMGIYSQFCETRSVLFSTDVASRGLDFNKAVDWVVQVDCPEDVAAYIHRVGRTARYLSGGKSVLFLMPSEMKMLEKLQEKKIPIQFIKANTKRLQPVSGLLAALLAKKDDKKEVDLRHLAHRAFITYLRSIHKHRDKEVFDVMKLPIEEFSASLGLPMTPKIRFLNQKSKGKQVSGESSLREENYSKENLFELPRESPVTGKLEEEEEDEEEVDKDFLSAKETPHGGQGKSTDIADIEPGTRILKKKKLKINVHRPVGTRVVFDDEGNTLPPLATLADRISGDGSVQLDEDRVSKRYANLRQELKEEDKEDKLLDRQRRKEKRMKEKMKRRRGRKDEDDVEGEEDLSGSDADRTNKRSKKYFDSDSDDAESKRDKDNSTINADSISLKEQEELALKLLSSMHS
ncbi:hypothetical protein RHMOL_Rhmol06G0296800 [Rhododendron molle]|uniref:Uncharacterized protein n=1 Tax=Rhododendron molle TaxID=49168 RepID=A0ACC0NJN9_RHOML|nr:hypothetical protein RHMOL_Rhmol06G0296800 [Rhododendron molle]